MADHWDKKTRRLLAEFDRIVEDAEHLREQVEASMRRPACWPERRHHGEHWWKPSADSDTDNNHSA